MLRHQRALRLRQFSVLTIIVTFISRVTLPKRRMNIGGKRLPRKHRGLLCAYRYNDKGECLFDTPAANLPVSSLTSNSTRTTNYLRM
jgi:hypothetical protein